MVLLARWMPGSSPGMTLLYLQVRAHDYRRQDRSVGDGHRARGPRPDHLERETVLRGGDRVRRRSEHAGQLRRCGVPGHAAGDQPHLRRAGDQDGPRHQRHGQRGLDLRPQELLLCGPAGRLSDLAIHAADRLERPADDRAGGRQDQGDRHHAPAYGAGRRQVAARPARDQDLCRPQPLGHRPDGDRVGARHQLARGGRRVPAQAAVDPALSGDLRRQHGGRLDALRCQRLGA
jgi:hypothetical protein